MFDTVLVANRGEIAVRIIRTLRRLGVRSVAVYSDADTGARHVREADVAVRIGPAAARESYLHVGRLLEAATATGAQAVHPGYGFLAENATFAEACADAKVIFIGPSPHAIAVMGDKITAKEAVQAAGVAVVPGRGAPGMSDGALSAAAAEVGFHVLLKPSAGGGGKGMRLVERSDDLADAVAGARREARSSFGDDTLLVERYVARPRHIEVQVLADNFGTIVHLGERECSLQRRHQKVIEEAPSVLLDPVARARIGAAACATARTVDYAGVGTVEFIVSSDAPDEFFFMEMNTRLQVEHPVTELITGIDLVEQQLRVAAGERLGFDQDSIQLDGHAIEARIYAEDPIKGFLPTGGRAVVVRQAAGPGVRTDSSLVEGAEVATAYDPMIAKVIAWGPDRPAALARLRAALADTVVLGMVTNIDFLGALLSHGDVVAGRLDTNLIERELETLLDVEVPDEVFGAYALHRLAEAWPTGPTLDPWDIPSGWRPNRPRPLMFSLETPDGVDTTVSITGTPSQAWVSVRGGPQVAASVVAVEGGMLVGIYGQTTTMHSVTVGLTTWIALRGRTWSLRESVLERRRVGHGVMDTEVRSPMPGNVVALRVAKGEEVAAGQALIVVEAMKMEHTLVAPGDGIVDLLVAVGDQVGVDQVLARVEPVAAAEESAP